MVLGRNIWFNIRKLSIDWLKIKQMMDLNGQGIPRTGRGFDGHHAAGSGWNDGEVGDVDALG